MKERGWIEPIVERVVGQVLDSHAAQLRTEIVRRVMEEIAAQPATAESSSQRSLRVRSCRSCARGRRNPNGTSQREILRALLDTCARYAARVALFVVKGSHATGWQARGFANNERSKILLSTKSAPAVARAIGDRIVVNAPVCRLRRAFPEEFGTPASGEARILPLDFER